MGGGPPPSPPLPPGNEPIPVGPMPVLGQPNPFQPLSQPQSVKGGSLQGLPGLQDVFNLPQGANPLFPNSQSFPQAPLMRSGQFPWPLPQPDLRVGPMLPVGPTIPAAPPPSTPTPPTRPKPEDQQDRPGER